MATQKPETDEDLLYRPEAAEYLKRIGFRISTRTLANMACGNNAAKGPRFTRYGWKTIRYRRGDLKRWAQANMETVE